MHDWLVDIHFTTDEAFWYGLQVTLKGGGGGGDVL